MTRTDKKKQIDKFKMWDSPQDTDSISAINNDMKKKSWSRNKDCSILK